MITFPQAKINLGLRIVGKREDGYHYISTCMQKIPLCDVLEVLPSDRLMWDGSPVVDEENLVIKAYRALCKPRPDMQGANLILRKKIPSGAGLGGGSSDASATLRMLDELFSLHLSHDELHSVALSLGADCPFFLTEKPQIAEGIGEVLEPYPLALDGLVLTLVFPDLFISTKEAYALVTPKSDGEDLRVTLRRPLEEWRHHLHNDFEDALFPKYPLLGEIKSVLYDSGALYASMSGSGSTMYALSLEPITLPSNYETQSFRFP